MTTTQSPDVSHPANGIIIDKPPTLSNALRLKRSASRFVFNFDYVDGETGLRLFATDALKQLYGLDAVQLFDGHYFWNWTVWNEVATTEIAELFEEFTSVVRAQSSLLRREGRVQAIKGRFIATRRRTMDARFGVVVAAFNKLVEKVNSLVFWGLREKMLFAIPDTWEGIPNSDGGQDVELVDLTAMFSDLFFWFSDMGWSYSDDFEKDWAEFFAKRMRLALENFRTMLEAGGLQEFESYFDN